jgi:hypothetical protein
MVIQGELRLFHQLIQFQVENSYHKSPYWIHDEYIIILAEHLIAIGMNPVSFSRERASSYISRDSFCKDFALQILNEREVWILREMRHQLLRKRTHDFGL